MKAKKPPKRKTVKPIKTANLRTHGISETMIPMKSWNLWNHESYETTEPMNPRKKFPCTCCNACCIGETDRHLSTRVHESLSSDKSSHIFKHLLSSERWRQSCSADCFEILDSTPAKFQLKLKEAMHICWEKPNLNQQPATYALGFIFFQTLCNSLKYVINFCHWITINYACYA